MKMKMKMKMKKMMAVFFFAGCNYLRAPIDPVSSYELTPPSIEAINLCIRRMTSLLEDEEEMKEAYKAGLARMEYYKSKMDEYEKKIENAKKDKEKFKKLEPIISEIKKLQAENKQKMRELNDLHTKLKINSDIHKQLQKKVKDIHNNESWEAFKKVDYNTFQQVIEEEAIKVGGEQHKEFILSKLKNDTEKGKEILKFYSTPPISKYLSTKIKWYEIVTPKMKSQDYNEIYEIIENVILCEDVKNAIKSGIDKKEIPNVPSAFIEPEKIKELLVDTYRNLELGHIGDKWSKEFMEELTNSEKGTKVMSYIHIKAEKKLGFNFDKLRAKGKEVDEIYKQRNILYKEFADIKNQIKGLHTMMENTDKDVDIKINECHKIADEN